MKLLLIGGRGQLGSDLIRLAQSKGDLDLVALDPPHADITRPETLRAALDAHNPDAVISTAAFHDVDACEHKATMQAFATNAKGIQELARQTAERELPFASFSTDYVYQGKPGSKPFTESDTPNPKSIYAASKLAGEKLALEANPRSLVIRSCGLYGETPPTGKRANFPDTMLALAKQGKPIKVVNDQICTPTWTRPLAEVVLALVTRGERGIVHATCDGACSWYDFAAAIFELAGIEANLSPITSAEYKAAAPRPPYSVLENARLAALGLNSLPHWKEALGEYLKLKGV